MAITTPPTINISTVYNFNPLYLQNFRLALSKVRDGAANAKILCLGDSTTHGFGCTTATGLGTLGSWPARLASLINTYMAPAAIGLGIPPISSAHDTRWTNNWVNNLGGFGFGNAANYNAPSPTGLLIYNPGTTWDRIDMYFLKTGSSGTLLANANNSTVGIATAAGAGNRIVGVQTLTASALAASTVSVTGSGGNVYVCGFEPWQSGTKQVLVGNAGCYGIQSSTAATSGGASQNWYALDALNAYAPNLTIICLGINDANATVSTATFKANMQAVISAAKVWGDVILLTYVPSGSGAGANYPLYEAQYIDVYKNLATTNNCVLVDIYNRWGASYNTLSGMYDFLHPNNYGYWDIASAIFSVLKQV